MNDKSECSDHYKSCGVSAFVRRAIRHSSMYEKMSEGFSCGQYFHNHEVSSEFRHWRWEPRWQHPTGWGGGSSGMSSTRTSRSRRTGRTMVDNVTSLLKHCLEKNCFMFEESYNKQKQGITMGSIVAPSVPVIFMHKLEERASENASIRPGPCARYIDDSIGIRTGSCQQLLDFLAYLSSQHRKINLLLRIHTQTGKNTIFEHLHIDRWRWKIMDWSLLQTNQSSKPLWSQTL